MGVSALVATRTIGDGAKARLSELLSRPESRIIFTSAAIPETRKARFGLKMPHSEGLRLADYYAIRDSNIDHVSAITPRIYVPSVKTRANGRLVEVSIDGQAAAGFLVMPRRLLDGTVFSAVDVARNANVCVLSQSLATALFPNSSPTSRVIHVSEVPLTVLGVVEDLTDSGTGYAHADLHVYLPFTTLLRRMYADAEMSINTQADDIERVDIVRKKIGELMEQRRGVRRSDFRTRTSSEFVKTYSASTLTITRLLAAIAAIALVVGGIGIANITLVCVAERTCEIGIRIAIGTRGRDVAIQFLTEAVMLSLFGGVVGTILGALCSWLLGRINDWPIAIRPETAILGLLSSLAVGVIFGYHPARQASLLNPVDSLRMER